MEYCSESLNHLSLYRGYQYNKPEFNLFEDFDKQLKTLYVQMVHSSLLAHSKILEKFPNLQFLKLNQNISKMPFNVKIHFPDLKHLYFQEEIYNTNRAFYSINYRKEETLEEYCKDFLKLNSQIENFELIMGEEWNPTFFYWLSDNLPQLQHLHLNCCQHQEFSDSASKPILFENIESFSLKKVYYNYFIDAIPFAFTKLKHFKLNTEVIHSTAILKFIERNVYLTSIELELESHRDFNIFRIFEIEHILLNVEKLSIDEIDCNIPVDRLMHFLKRNTSLKSFSIIMKSRMFIEDLIYLIIAGNFEAKIRNNALEFTITRITDGSFMKYVMRYTKHPSKKNNYDCYIHQNKYKNFFEFCNYEKPKFEVREIDVPRDYFCLVRKYLRI